MITGARCSILVAVLMGVVALLSSSASWAQIGKPRVEVAIAAIRALDRPGRDILATVWDGNKYIQCRRTSDRTLVCEAAGTLMQPSLARILTSERVGRLAAMGWMIDPRFGNYVQTFGTDVATADIAGKIVDALAEAYDADVTSLAVATNSIKSEPCPPRHGPSQNLAGMIDDAASMASVTLHVCAYKPRSSEVDHKLGAESTTAELVDLYGPKVAAEIGRLRVNLHGHRRVFVAFDTGLGYVQCEPETGPDVFYCEAESADSWPALAAILTPERVARLHAYGFADPGRAPNFSKTYPVDAVDDAALARDVLTVLHDVYGYYGASKLEVATEEGR